MEELVIEASFWQGKRVLITGHTGFKGSWLCLWLQAMGARTVGYSLPPATQPNLFELVRLESRMESIFADVRDARRLRSVFARQQPEIVFHLAAQALILPSYADPADTYASNVMGTVNLLDAVRQHQGVQAVVIVTSDKCYDNRYDHRGSAQAYREDDRLGGCDPYSSSKACAELVSAAYRSSFFASADHPGRGPALATARAGNAIGGGDWSPDRLIPDAIRAFTQHRPLPLRHPDAIRPWQHVLEPLAGYLMLAEQLSKRRSAFAVAWNFGPPDEHTRSVQEVIETLAGLWGVGATWIRDNAAHPHEAHCLRLDASKARSLLQWRTRWSLDRSLRMTVEWYRAHSSGQDMAEFSRQQIDSYCAETRHPCVT